MENVKTKSPRKVILLVIITIVTLIIGITIYFFNFMYPYRGTVKNPVSTLALEDTLTRKEALKDLKYLMKHLKDYHPAYLDGSKHLTEAVHNQYQIELDALGEEVTALELWHSATRIVAKLHDSHTTVSYNNPNNNYIADFTQLQEYEKPIAIDGINTADLLTVYKAEFPFEIEAYADQKFFSSIVISESFLKFFGIDTSDGVTFTFQTKDGTADYHYIFVPFDEVLGYNNKASDTFVSYDIDKDNNLAIFKLSQCNYNKEYLSVLDQFFKEVKDNNITNIAVDLRSNGGGNSMVANAFLEYIDIDTYETWESGVRFGWYLLKETNTSVKNQKKDNVFKGNIYTLTNMGTFSSGMDFAMLIGDNDIGYIVGEASGNMPNSYGDLLYFQLPNSKLCFNISYKKWYRIDKTKADEPLTPDYEIASGKALEKVYELIKR